MSNFYKFSNNVTVVNATPHPIRFKDLTGEIVTIDSNLEYLINAEVQEEITVDEDLGFGIEFTQPRFVATEDGWGIVSRIRKEHGMDAVIIGSIIAAQAYGGAVCGMVPVPGFERVAPAEKLMRVDRFTRYCNGEPL